MVLPSLPVIQKLLVSWLESREKAMSFLASSTSTHRSPNPHQNRSPSKETVENKASGALLSSGMGCGDEACDLPIGIPSEQLQDAMGAIGLDDEGQSIMSPIAIKRDSFLAEKSSEDPDLSDSLVPIQRDSKAETGDQIIPSGDECFENSGVAQESRIEGDEEIENAQTLVGASSKVFMEHLRGAAFRRKMNLTRSRDSLVAKEKVQREALAASKVTFQIEDHPSEKKHHKGLQFDERRSCFKARPVPSANRERTASGLPNVKKRPSTVAKSPLLGRRRESTAQQPSLKNQGKKDDDSALNRKSTFRAKPLPRTTGSFGHGGQVGLPQVSKRHTTVPISPTLGLNKRVVMKEPKSQSNEGKENWSFKARPAPKTTGVDGRGGLSGVTKVEKRPLTLPLSPLLGNRRPMADAECEKSTASIDLIGVDFVKTPAGLASTPLESESLNIKPFVPHSEQRAMHRAEFEEKRRVHETQRMREESEIRQQKIAALNKELQRIRPVI